MKRDDFTVRACLDPWSGIFSPTLFYLRFQNVNKVSTKATVRLPLPPPESSVPPSSSDKSSSEKAEAPVLRRLKLWKGWLPWFVIPSLWKSVSLLQ